MIGSTISHYKILEKLGEGGMGVVYRAQDLKLNRFVALKFLPTELTRDAEAKERFILEAQAASALDHSNICTVYEISETDDGQLFIAMAYYEGKTLDAHIRQGRLQLLNALDLAIQIARGLDKAHEKGIIHRDIKPSNIIVTADGIAKILDFGLAKLTGQIRVTKVTSTMGTVAYMSPEQAQGLDVDERTDVWSLGIILYEMLAGSLPFRGNHEAAILYSITNENPAALSKLRPDLPADFIKVVDKMLQKDPAHRIASTREVDEELSRFQPGKGNTATSFLTLRNLKRPVFAIPLTMILLGLVYLSYYWINRSSKISWAHNLALPEIIRLVDEGEWSSAYKIAKNAAEYIPRDPVLLKYVDESSWIVSFKTVPSGAQVSYKAYSDSSQDWINLGSTPILGPRIPRGVFRFRVVKAGFTEIERVFDGSNKASPHDTAKGSQKLDTLGIVPEDMVHVPAATFRLYAPGLDNIRPVTAGDYFIDKYEVTNKQFKQFVDSGGYRNRKYWKHSFIKQAKRLSWEEAMGQFLDATGRQGPSTWEVGTYPEGKGSYPVGGVSWYEAAAYAEFAGKSLPSIFHWNRAAYPWQAASIISQSNFSGIGPVQTGSRLGTSLYGTYDMAGNVREWCWNQSKERRFVLGGGWNDLPYSFTDAYTQAPFDRSVTNGFRCVKYAGSIQDSVFIFSSIEIARRDYRKEKPASDLLFKSYLRLYAYDQKPLHETVEILDTTENWFKQLASFDAAYGNERMTAYLFLPKNAVPPYQTVVIFPGSDAIFARSSKQVSDRYSGNFFVKSGHAVVFPIYKGTYERGDGLNTDTPDETNSYKEHVIQWTKDFSRVLDYLDTRSDIDNQRIAYYGVSWGGQMGGLIPAVESRIKTVILNVGGLVLQKSQPEADPINFVKHVKVPVLMINGKYDQFFPVETSQKPMFELLGTPREHKKQFIYDASHIVPTNLVAKQSLEWLDHYFGQVKLK